MAGCRSGAGAARGPPPQTQKHVEDAARAGRLAAAVTARDLRELRLAGTVSLNTPPVHDHTRSIALGSHPQIFRSKWLALVNSAGPAARSPNTASSTTGLRLRTAAKKLAMCAAWSL